MAESGCLRSIAVQNISVAGNIENSTGATATVDNFTTTFVRSLHGKTGIDVNTDIYKPIIEAINNLPAPTAGAAAITANYAARLNEMFGSEIAGGDPIAAAAAAAATKAQVKRVSITGDTAVDQIADGARDPNVWQVYRIEGDATNNNRVINLPAAVVGHSLLFVGSSDAVFPDNGGGPFTLTFTALDAYDAGSLGVSATSNKRTNVTAAQAAAGNTNLVLTPQADNLAFGASFIMCTCSVAGTWHIAFVGDANVTPSFA